MMDALEKISYSLENESNLDPLVEQAGGMTAVLIGGATHGTSEFYEWRAKITQRLIAEKGFSFVAVEGDWPSCYQVNRYVRGQLSPDEGALNVLSAFNRWPTWLWANQETLDFIKWLADHNEKLPVGRRIGFYGLDIYSLWESLDTVVDYIEKNIPEAAEIARQTHRCFESHWRYTESYPWVMKTAPESCEDDAIRLLSTLGKLPPTGIVDEIEEQFNIRQNAQIVADAERYFRVMLKDDPDSWNLREEHMARTFFHLLVHYSKVSVPKGIIWAHNTHVGDSSATDIANIDRVSVGKLVRDGLPVGETFLIGFGTYQGSVIAADDWYLPMRDMILPPAIFESWEHTFHNFKQGNRLVLFSKDREAAKFFAESNGHRGIGVIFDPSSEFDNYVPVILSNRYDAFLYIDETSALHPLSVELKIKGPPDTFPSAA